MVTWSTMICAVAMQRLALYEARWEYGSDVIVNRVVEPVLIRLQMLPRK